MKKVILFLGCCLLGWGTTGLMAQQGNVAAGGQATGAGGTVSYSIGQVNFLSAEGIGGSLNQGLQHPGGFSLCGTLTYDNTSATVLNNTNVLLLQGNNIIYQDLTDDNGYYQINNPESGSYLLGASCTKPWGSVNATDALLILKHYVGIDPLTGLRLVAGDVNASGYVNASDGLVVMKRFTGLQSSFVTGDWAFEHPPVTISGPANMTVDFKGICYGDVDGSYVPPYIKIEPTLFLDNQGIQVINNNQLVRVPVRLSQDLNSAAVSLIMNYPANQIDVVGVEAAYDNEILVYNAQDGELRIAWYTLAPRMLNKDDALMTLTLKLKDSGYGNLDFTLNALSSIADFQGKAFENKHLYMPFLVNGNQGFSLSQNIPNPFSGLTQINFVLPEDGFVKLELTDVIGQQINLLLEGQMNAGSHSVVLSGNELPNGIYFYRMLVDTETQQFTQTKRMVVSH